MTPRRIDVLVVGAGPAGLAVATAVRRACGASVLVVDRESEAGGAPRWCANPGFGVADLGLPTSGPRYARMRTRLATASGAEVLTGTTALPWTTAPDGALLVPLSGPQGPCTVSATAVVLATGATERHPVGQVPGADLPGVLTTGQMQRMLAAGGSLPGGERCEVVVVGAEAVSYSAAVTLAKAGHRVRAIVEQAHAPRAPRALHEAVQVALAVPVLRNASVTLVEGGSYGVDAVHVRNVDGRRARVRCDTVVFTGSWHPEADLARDTGLLLDPATGGPAVDTRLRTTHDGVFAVGNLVHPVLMADRTAVLAPEVVGAVVDHLRHHGRARPRTAPTAGTALQPGEGVRAVFPQRVLPGGVRPPGGQLLVWPDRPGAEVLLHQDGREIGRVRPCRSARTWRPLRVSTGWIDALDPYGSPVTVTLSR